MNAMILLAQGAMNMADSLATANPVLTEVNAPEMNMLDMAIKGGWIMIVLGVLSVVCFYILFERNYMIRKAGKEDPMFMERIKDYIHSGEIKAAINYCRTMNTPSARMIEKGISRLGRPINDVQAAIENVGNIEVAKLEKGLTVIFSCLKYFTVIAVFQQYRDFIQFIIFHIKINDCLIKLFIGWLCLQRSQIHRFCTVQISLIHINICKPLVRFRPGFVLDHSTVKILLCNFVIILLQC